jgi:hypothetical protein
MFLRPKSFKNHGSTSKFTHKLHFYVQNHSKNRFLYSSSSKNCISIFKLVQKSYFYVQNHSKFIFLLLSSSKKRISIFKLVQKSTLPPSKSFKFYISFSKLIQKVHFHSQNHSKIGFIPGIPDIILKSCIMQISSFFRSLINI